MLTNIFCAVKHFPIRAERDSHRLQGFDGLPLRPGAKENLPVLASAVGVLAENLLVMMGYGEHPARGSHLVRDAPGLEKLNDSRSRGGG